MFDPLGSGDAFYLPGADKIEELIHLHGDTAAIDLDIARLVDMSRLLAIGEPVPGEDRAHLLFCDVPCGDTTITTLPVFTRIEFADNAVFTNPTWTAWRLLVVPGDMLLREASDSQCWLGINLWSHLEFKLPPHSWL